MNKELRKAIMHRSNIRNRYNKNKTVENFNACKTQRNRCVNILRKTKRVFTDTVKVCLTIKLIENDEFVSEDLAIAEVFKHYSTNITKELEIRVNKTHLSTTHGIDDLIDIAIIKYSKYPSIKKIKEGLTPSKAFSFRNIITLEALEQIEKLSNRKASHIYSIPARVLKENPLIFADVLKKRFNNSLDECTFPTN